MTSMNERQERLSAPTAFSVNDVQAVANALAHEAAEHGVPNSFSPGELHQRYRVPNVLTIGKIGKWFPVGLNVCLRVHGLTAVYANRRFHVTARTED